MDDNNFIEEILNYLGYKKVNADNSEKNNSKKQQYCKIDYSGGADSNCCADVNMDIPNGFQDLDPILFLVVGELIGNIIAGSTPFNVANAISNYLNLIGQVIETYAGQQAYFQGGPGRLYNKKYKNITNPFMSCAEKDNSKADNDDNENVYEKIKNIEIYLNLMKDNFSREINEINLKIDKIESVYTNKGKL